MSRLPWYRPARLPIELAAKAAWAVWAAVALLSLVLTLLALPVYFQQYSALSLFAGQADRQIARDSLAQFGFSPTSFAWYAVAFQGLRVLVSFAIAAMIVRAKSGRMALFVSGLLMAIAAGRTLYVTPETQTWGWPVAVLLATAHAGLILFFYIFPEGRFAPRWTRWVALMWGLVLVPASLFPNAWFGLGNWPSALYLLVLAGVLATGVAAQVYRYRRVAGPVARQQIKWVLYGAAILTLVALVYAALDLTERPRSVQALLDPQIRLYDVTGIAIGSLALVTIPLSVGIAVLRYHLWNVDVVISRTLVYVPLTAIVAGMYVASITLGQRLLTAHTGQQSDLAVVLITLLVTSLVQPINVYAQRFVDRRFKESPRTLTKLMTWGEDVASAVYDVNSRQVVRRLLEEASEAVHAESGAAYLTLAGRPELVHRRGQWTTRESHVSIPIDVGDLRLGLLRLGERRDGMTYRPHEIDALRQAAGKVAHALHQHSDLQPSAGRPPVQAAAATLQGTPNAQRVAPSPERRAHGRAQPGAGRPRERGTRRA